MSKSKTIDKLAKVVELEVYNEPQEFKLTPDVVAPSTQSMGWAECSRFAKKVMEQQLNEQKDR